ncbi:unnamed protein product [Brachionus calyciflorus]|nr:unnamed protein product [Brachionus calyciflorus]
MGLDGNTRDKYGRSCLILACLSDHEDYGLQVAKLLLKYHADLNLQDSLGRTPVFVSCSEKREKLFNLFMDEHTPFIDFRLKDNDGDSLINYVAIHGSVFMLRKIIEIMSQRKVEIDQKNNLGYTALLQAIKHDKFLNAYYLIKDGQASTNLKDNEYCLNALEWLFSRIHSNKEKILNNEFESSSNSNINQRKQSSIPNYKTWYGSLNQYFLSSSCDHVTNPNLSIEHHRSRYIPLILKNKTLNLDNVQPIRQSKLDYFRQKSFDTMCDKSSFVSSEFSEDLDESMSTKEKVQKLYEIIFRRMSQSLKQSRPEKTEPEPEVKPKTLRKQSLTLRQRSLSIKPNDIKIEEIKEKIEKIKPVLPKPEIKLDMNIFDLEELRYTPKLIALSETNKSGRTSKDIVHKMFDLYDSFSNSGSISNYQNNPNTHGKLERKVSVVDHEVPKLLSKLKKSYSNSISVHVKFK